jgi:hypothetical protein
MYLNIIRSTKYEKLRNEARIIKHEGRSTKQSGNPRICQSGGNLVIQQSEGYLPIWQSRPQHSRQLPQQSASAAHRSQNSTASNLYGVPAIQRKNFPDAGDALRVQEPDRLEQPQGTCTIAYVKRFPCRDVHPIPASYLQDFHRPKTTHLEHLEQPDGNRSVSSIESAIF